MREHLHGSLVREEVLQMIQYEDTNALFGIFHAFQSRLQTLHDGAEGVFLDEIKQPLFRFEVVIESSQRHAAFARKIAHRGALVSFFTEDVSGTGENLS